MKVERIVIFANTTKKEISETADEMLEFLKSKGIQADLVMLESNENDSTIKVGDYDLAISLGGDGTVLTCAGLLYEKSIPLLAVNMGTFGYMAETSVTEYKEVLNDFINEKTGYAKRMRLKTKVLRNGRNVFEGTALNDIVVSSATRAKTAKLNLCINSTFAAGLKSDGIIIATPTGSTAYNLSAGGPILEETLNCMIVNPICSFTLSARPLVIDEKSTVQITLPEQPIKIVVSCDGHEAFVLKDGDIVEISKSRESTLLVKNNKRNTIEILRTKLGWSGGFNA